MRKNALLVFVSTFFCATSFATVVAHTLAIVADYDSQSQKCTKADVKSLLFGPRTSLLSLSEHFLQISNNAFTIDGDVFDGFVLDTTNQTGCFYKITDVANAAALAAGINISRYDHLMYFVPQPKSCAFNGWSTIGGSPGESVSFSCKDSAIALHEFSHGQFSVQHSGQRNNPDPYADHSCPMGMGYHPYNAAWMHQIGWQTSEALNTTGDYALSPLDIPQSEATHPQIYAIATNHGQVFLSTRVNTPGHQAHEAANLAGVNVHFHASPSVDSVQEYVLSTGDFYCNKSYGFCVNQVSKDATATVFHIEMHPPGSNYWKVGSASRTPSVTRSITQSPKPTPTRSVTSFPTLAPSPSAYPSVSSSPSASHSASRSALPTSSAFATPSQTPSHPHIATSEGAALYLNLLALLLSALLAT